MAEGTNTDRHPRVNDFASLARDAYGFDIDVHEFPAGTKTATDAAAAIGCSTEQIACSIVLDGSDGLVVVIASGANRIDMDKAADAIGTERLAMAEPDDVRETLGWSIGGVPPICHEDVVPMLFDEMLLEHDVVWVATGTPTAVFPIEPAVLVELTGATVGDVRQT